MAQTSTAPNYTPAHLANAASNVAQPLAPNTLATLYGTNLSYGTRALSAEDIRANVLPTSLPGTGVRILIGGVPCSLYYVSPTQVNFLVPSNLRPGQHEFYLARDGILGPVLSVKLDPASPALFQVNGPYAVALRPDGTVVTPQDRAKPGDTLVLYATGLGTTSPEARPGQLSTIAARLADATFRVFLNGEAASASAVQYAGLAPGFGGLYQINLRLPESTPEDAEIRLGFGDQPASLAGVKLATRR